MTVEEALAFVESALDYQQLSKVQELVFRNAWEGRSYTEIARTSDYEADYIKSSAAKLWKLMSEAFGEKVKKGNLQSVIKRYARRIKVNLQRNLVIEVNLSGANLSGANLSGARLFANLNEADFVQADGHQPIISDEKTESDLEEPDNQESQSNPENRIYSWNGHHLRSQEHVKIAEALERIGILFIPNPKLRLTTSEGRDSQEFDFMILHQGKWGILQINGEELLSEPVSNEDSHRLLQYHGIRLVYNCDVTRCGGEPDRVVQEFLETLSHV
ncbi:MAG: hypothetical protein Fur0025_43450 [Oscillatoriaceae cyanobacterium]